MNGKTARLLRKFSGVSSDKDQSKARSRYQINKRYWNRTPRSRRWVMRAIAEDQWEAATA